MYIDYSKLKSGLKESLTPNVFKHFTDAVGGDLNEFVDTLFNKFTIDDFAYHDDWYYFGIVEYFRKTVVPHKIAVYEAGMDLLSKKWIDNYLQFDQDKGQFQKNLWLHDLSKFSANEAFGYAMYDFKNPNEKSKPAFEAAWHHHKMNNPHHPEYWLNPNRSGELEPITMPPIYAIEMVADWMGAGKTYGSSLEDWLPNNLHKFKFGINKSLIKNILEDLGIQTWIHEGNVLKTAA